MFVELLHNRNDVYLIQVVSFSYASKTWLSVKEDHYSEAELIFGGSGVRLTKEGRPHLGAPLGTSAYRNKFLSSKVIEWCAEIEALAGVANTEPHAAYAACTHGMFSKWSFLSRVVPDIGPLLQPLEDSIRYKLLPVLTGRPPFNDLDRQLTPLPAKFGGLGIFDPSERSKLEFDASVRVTQPLTSAILQGDESYSYDTMAGQITAIAEVSSMKKFHSKEVATILKGNLTGPLKRAVELAQEKGASSWLTALPIQEHGFALHKSAFRDALALRYDWPPSHLPSSCACGASFSTEHALSCPKGGFPSLRHNEIFDLTANLLTEVCSNVCVEPELQPLSGESLKNRTANTEDHARLDIAANGLWGGRNERNFVDVRVFNPHAPTNKNTPLQSAYRTHEKMKKRAYQQRVLEIEHASFTPVVLSATGGMANEATFFYKRIASLLALKWDQPYSTVMTWLRCRITFALLHSAIQCLRGARSSRGHACKLETPVDLVTSESQLPLEH